MLHTSTTWRPTFWIKCWWQPLLYRYHVALPLFFFYLFLIIIALSLQTIEANWRCGRHNLQRIQCRSENSKGVYCLQYDDDKIISGLRDNSIKVCVHPTPRDSLHLDADYIGDEVPCTRLHNIWLLFSMALLCFKCNSHYSCYYYTDCFCFF